MCFSTFSGGRNGSKLLLATPHSFLNFLIAAMIGWTCSDKPHPQPNMEDLNVKYQYKSQVS